MNKKRCEVCVGRMSTQKAVTTEAVNDFEEKVQAMQHAEEGGGGHLRDAGVQGNAFLEEKKVCSTQ